MSRLLPVVLLAGLAALSGGCAMCCAPFDDNYPPAAGRWVRNNPSSGRVGSAFDEAGGPAGAVPLETIVTQPTTTLPAAPPAAPPSTPRYSVPRNLGETYLPRGE